MTAVKETECEYLRHFPVQRIRVDNEALGSVAGEAAQNAEIFILVGPLVVDETQEPGHGNVWLE